MKRKSFILILGLIISLTLSHTCFAEPLWYGNIVSVSGDTALLEFRGLEQKHDMSCVISTRECSETSTLLTNTILSPNTSSHKNNFRFPSISIHRNGSSNNIFKFYTTISSSNKRTLSLVNTKTKKTYSISSALHFWNLLDLQPRVSKFSPDNTKLAYIDDRSGFISLYITNLTTLSKTGLSGTKITSDVSVGDFTFADSHTLLYVANTTSDPYDWVLYSYDTDTKVITPLVHHLTYDSVLHQSGNSIIFTKLGQLGTIPVILTDYHGTDLQDFKLSISTPASTNTISYTYQNIAGFDTVVMSNHTIDTVKHPLIIWLHGGPYRQSSFVRHTYISYGVYDWDLEQAVNQGAYVVKIDYPGSYGSGRKNTESIKSGVGLVDVKSVEDVINDFVAHNTVDGVYLVGNSYGGYLALRTAVAYPDQVDGALSINGVTDWQSLMIFYKNSIFNEFFGGLPSSHNKKLFAQASIFSRVKNLKHPVYIIQGEADSTVPKFQATALKSALDTAGKQSTLLMIPNENHVFEKDSSINTICTTLFQMVGFSDTSSCNLNG